MINFNSSLNKDTSVYLYENLGTEELVNLSKVCKTQNNQIMHYVKCILQKPPVLTDETFSHPSSILCASFKRLISNKICDPEELLKKAILADDPILLRELLRIHGFPSYYTVLLALKHNRTNCIFLLQESYLKGKKRSTFLPFANFTHALLLSPEDAIKGLNCFKNSSALSLIFLKMLNNLPITEINLKTMKVAIWIFSKLQENNFQKSIAVYFPNWVFLLGEIFEENGEVKKDFGDYLSRIQSQIESKLDRQNLKRFKTKAD